MSPRDRDTLAAEYVLGLLDGDERREAERLAAGDPGFQAAIISWQGRFAELDESARPVAAGDALWRRIEGSLAAAPVRAADPTPVLVPDPRNAFRALWHNLAFWRLAGLAGAAASLLLAVGVAVFAERSARAPILVAVLLTDANRPAGIINAYRDGEAELVPFAGLQIPQGRAFEVWAIPGPNRNPISVGLVTEPRSLRLDLQRVPGLGPDQTFAISVEPPQGSPTGLPTGPVLLRGTTTTAL